LETHRLYDELLFAEQLELLVGTDLNEPFDIITAAVEYRRNNDPDFPEIRRERLPVVR